MQDNNVVIISNNKLVAEQLISKIVLLRSIDSIAVVDYKNALSLLQKQIPDLILIYTSDNENTDIIKKIKFNESLKNIPIIYIAEIFNQELLLTLFDEGISDFLTLNSNEAQFLIRIMWGLQKRELLKELENKTKILESTGIIDKEFGFYKNEFTERFFKNKIKNIIQNKEQAIFMVLSADISCKNTLPLSFLASVLKKSLRKEDIIGFAPNNRFYIILNKTDKDGVLKVYKKIKENLNETYSVSAAAIQIQNSNFESTERLLKKGLDEAMSKGSSLIFMGEKKDNKTLGLLDKSNLKETNFKMFKQIFLKKIDKIVTPIFFQTQTILQEKLFETKIEQYVNEYESLFLLERETFKSYIKIKYPGYSKINIDVTHTSSKKETKERITLELNELTQIKIEEILQKLIKTFQTNTKEL